MQELDLSQLKAFYNEQPAALANVDLRLANGRSASSRQDKRTFTTLTKCSKAAEQLGHLPESSESRHCVLKGDFALFDFISASLSLSGEAIDELLVATLSVSKKNAEDLGQLVASGQIKSLAILVSHYFSAAENAIYEQVVETCRQHGGRVVAMRTHAKVLLMTIGKRRLVVESSANLRSCHNVEQATMFNDADLYAFHREWITELLDKGESQRARQKA